MGKCSQDGIEDFIQFLTHIVSQKSQDKIPVLLQLSIFLTIMTVCLRVRQMLGTINFNSQSSSLIQQIHLQAPAAIEWYLERGVEAKSPGGFRQCFQSPIQERLCSAPRTSHTLIIRRK